MEKTKLDAQQFQRLCSVLKVPQPKGDDRRRSGRIEFRTNVSVALAEGAKLAPPVTSALRDISPTGATLSHPTALKPGSKVVFFLGTEAEPVRVVARVVHCKFFSDGTSLLGVEFENLIDPARAQARKSA